MAAMAKVMSSRAAVLNRSGWKIAVCWTSLGETDWGCGADVKKWRGWCQGVVPGVGPREWPATGGGHLCF